MEMNRQVPKNNNESRQDTPVSEIVPASEIGETFFHDKINVKNYFVNKG
jgi:hypothetical protein